MPPHRNPLAAIATSRIRRWVLSAFPRGRSGIDYDHPPGDPGLFGPDSVTWRIHADFPGMLSGGLCALMLQTLHPRALAGVWDHSNFRDDLVGRLRRTTAFVAGTTYAGHEQASRLIARVAAIHARVQGTLPDGRAYAADAPDLLTWVHVTESYGFLQGYRRYCRRDLPAAAADRYYDEARRVAETLGARDVPASEAGVADYFARARDELACDARSREVLAVLERIRLPVPAAGLSRELFLGAGAALLPDWARDMLERSTGRRIRDAFAARTLAGLAPLFRTALDDGVAPRACARLGVDPAILQRLPDLDAVHASHRG
ncbi:DUF2236 domain-containing protein [Luteimonas sp. SJ-92]|uniref:DUF2236 domain-containing protein n=1 Tax=Luteimonas salinisoli TaxID=2752307 RepID=A0A853JAU4_9GAMM|nr:oxygenase MpaB family protein [Luteimonas salinisoli]NZA26323.1 DUF2236 domain-containing protein [Luteimonas salinisoli]